MAINPLNPHYSFENPATVYDEEALTALELAGRTAAKVIEAVTAFNELEENTNNHLEEQDKEIDERMDAQDASIENIRTVTVPADVKAECKRLIDAGEFDAAINLYLNNLNARVDNLLGSVSEGSTTLDAEIIDVRTGDDGEVYDNAGNAVRSQFARVNNVLQIKPEWIEGCFISKDTGRQHTHATYDSSPFIEIPVKMKKIGVHTSLDSDNSGCCFYDVNKNYISGYNPGNSSKVYSEFVLDVPEGARYIRFSHRNAYLPKDNSYLFSVTDLFELLREEKEDIDYITVNTTTNGYLGPGGVITNIDNENFQYAEINVTPGHIYTLTAAHVHSSRMYAIYNERGNVIDIYPKESAQTKKVETVTFTIPYNGVKMIVSTYDHEILLYENINYNVLNERIDNVEKELVSIDNKNGIYAYGYDSVLCIGDSLTAGACYVNGWTGGAIKQNYPYYLGRMLNATVTNGGRSGWSASDWHRDYIQFYDFSTYDAFVIWLGTNYGCNTMPTDEEIEEFVPDATVSPDVANQSLYLIDIVKTIKAQNPDAVIFLCTVFASKSDRSANNEVIRQIASKYGCSIIDMQGLDSTSRPDLHGYIANVHFSKVGNMAVANHVREHLHKYIADNPANGEFGY